MSVTFEELDMGFENTTMIRPLVQAIREKKRVDISDTSLEHGVDV